MPNDTIRSAPDPLVALRNDPLWRVIADAIDTTPVADAASYVAGHPASDAMVSRVLTSVRAALDSIEERSREDGLREALAAVGLPETASVDDLIRHHRNNEAATNGAWKLAYDGLKEKYDALAAASPSREDTETCPTCWQPVLVPQRGDHDYGIPLAAASPSREGAGPGLREDLLAKALFATHPMLYPESWPDDDPDDIGPNPSEDAATVAAEYARLASEEQREDGPAGG